MVWRVEEIEWEGREGPLGSRPIYFFTTLDHHLTFKTASRPGLWAQIISFISLLVSPAYNSGRLRFSFQAPGVTGTLGSGGFPGPQGREEDAERTWPTAPDLRCWLLTEAVLHSCLSFFWTSPTQRMATPWAPLQGSYLTLEIPDGSTGRDWDQAGSPTNHTTRPSQSWTTTLPSSHSCLGVSLKLNLSQTHMHTHTLCFKCLQNRTPLCFQGKVQSFKWLAKPFGFDLCP